MAHESSPRAFGHCAGTELISALGLEPSEFDHFELLSCSRRRSVELCFCHRHIDVELELDVDHSGDERENRRDDRDNYRDERLNDRDERDDNPGP